MTARRHAPLAVSLAALLALAGGSTPLGAQQRVEIVPTRGRADVAHQRVLRLKAYADSLAQVYGSSDELSAAERQVVGEELDRTMVQLEQAIAHRDRALRAGAMAVRMAPMRDPRAAERMSRVLVQGTRTTSPAPRGWLGIVVNGLAREPRIERGELIVHYLTYPEILSVEPSSPAERAGLVPGDTLIAYDGRDVRDVDISMTRLLRPNARVQVRIARGGRQRDVPVIIADAPSRIVLRAEEMRPARRATDPLGVASGGEFAGSRAVWRSTVPTPRQPGVSGVAGVAPAAPVPTAPGAVSGLAGAHVGSLTREWARLTGVSRGVLVISVPPGTQAASSGLRDADVIVRAAGREVRSVAELRDLMARAWSSGERTLAIEYVRERTARAGMLRW